MEIFAHFYSRILLCGGQKARITGEKGGFCKYPEYLLGHFSEAVTEGVDDQLEAIGNLEL